MKFIVDNMTCAHCKMHVEKALKAVGFKKINVDLETKEVSCESKKYTLEDAKQAITGIGYNFTEL